MLAIAAAVMVTALAGGAAVWLATSADDDPSERTTSVATAPSTTDPEPETSSEPSAESTMTDEEAQPDGAAEPRGDREATESTPRGARTTRFPRDRGKARAQSTPKRFAVPPAREFSGEGNARLGTVELRTSVVVKWSTNGRFELRFGRDAFPIIAPSPSGQLVVPPYSFDHLRVIADGRWRIRITPQK
jgi:hypothetical protein